MEYTQLTTKELIAHTIGIIREQEGKCHGLEVQILMNERLAAHYKAQRPPNKNGTEAARQAIARDKTLVFEIQAGMPAALAHLTELQELDAAEDAAKETATEQASDDTVSDLDDAPIDLTDEADPEPTPIQAKTRKGSTFGELNGGGSLDAIPARELVPV